MQLNQYNIKGDNYQIIQEKKHFCIMRFELENFEVSKFSNSTFECLRLKLNIILVILLNLALIEASVAMIIYEKI